MTANKGPVEAACERYLDRLREWETLHFIKITSAPNDENTEREARAAKRRDKALTRLISIAQKQGREAGLVDCDREERLRDDRLESIRWHMGERTTGLSPLPDDYHDVSNGHVRWLLSEVARLEAYGDLREQRGREAVLVQLVDTLEMNWCAPDQLGVQMVCDEIERHQMDTRDLEAQFAAAQEQVRVLREALKEYGRHRGRCYGGAEAREAQRGCVCGFTAALDATCDGGAL